MQWRYKYYMSREKEGGTRNKEPACQSRKGKRCVPRSGRFPGVGNGNPFSILAWRIPKDRGI